MPAWSTRAIVSPAGSAHRSDFHGCGIEVWFHTPPTGFDECLIPSSDLSCPPSGLVRLQGHGKNQLSDNTDGTGKLDHHHDLDLMGQTFADFEVQVYETFETTIHEGPAHCNISALVGLIARKP